jgi:anti-sigma factor ChrR (cupin superfamily)
MKKWQTKSTDQIATGKKRSALTQLIPERRKFADDVEHLSRLLSHTPKKIKPSAAVKDRLMARLETKAPATDAFVVAEADRKWKTVFPGVKECTLSEGEGRLSRLLKIRKGFILPPHRHREIEQAFILEGRCYSGKVLLQKGDYFFAHADTKHARVKALEDCLILLVAHR